MPTKVRGAMTKRLKVIAADPFAKHAGVTALKGATDVFRLRHRDWRGVYEIDRDARLMRVVTVAKRGEVYR